MRFARKLAPGKHPIKIVVTGRHDKGAEDTYVQIGEFIAFPIVRKYRTACPGEWAGFRGSRLGLGYGNCCTPAINDRLHSACNTFVFSIRRSGSIAPNKLIPRGFWMRAAVCSVRCRRRVIPSDPLRRSDPAGFTA